MALPMNRYFWSHLLCFDKALVVCTCRDLSVVRFYCGTANVAAQTSGIRLTPRAASLGARFASSLQAWSWISLVVRLLPNLRRGRRNLSPLRSSRNGLVLNFDISRPPRIMIL
jgi:hypothetical protein